MTQVLHSLVAKVPRNVGTNLELHVFVLLTTSTFLSNVESVKHLKHWLLKTDKLNEDLLLFGVDWCSAPVVLVLSQGIVKVNAC